MTHWDREREEYLLSKRDSEELAAVCFVALIIMVLAGLALEAWYRIFG